MVFGECAFLPFSVGPPGDRGARGHGVTLKGWTGLRTTLETVLQERSYKPVSGNRTRFVPRQRKGLDWSDSGVGRAGERVATQCGSRGAGHPSPAVQPAAGARESVCAGCAAQHLRVRDLRILSGSGLRTGGVVVARHLRRAPAQPWGHLGGHAPAQPCGHLGGHARCVVVHASHLRVAAASCALPLLHARRARRRLGRWRPAAAPPLGRADDPSACLSAALPLA